MSKRVVVAAVVGAVLALGGVGVGVAVSRTGTSQVEDAAKAEARRHEAWAQRAAAEHVAATHALDVERSRVVEEELAAEGKARAEADADIAAGRVRY